MPETLTCHTVASFVRITQLAKHEACLFYVPCLILGNMSCLTLACLLLGNSSACKVAITVKVVKGESLYDGNLVFKIGPSHT